MESIRIKKALVATLFAIIGSYVSFAQQQHNVFSIIPKPAFIQAKNETFLLSSQTQVIAKSAETRKMLSLFNDLLWERYKIRLPATSLDLTENVIILNEITGNKTEAYNLDISNKQILIKGGSAGVFYGLQSLLQLIEQTDGQLTIPGATLNDKPEFGYRGLMIDVARHFFSLDQMKKIVDQMAYFKFNTLHWHLTDDQGWRLEIKKYPKLTQVSAWRDSTIIGHHRNFKPFIYDGLKHGGYYTQEEARELVRYAAERKITVIPEIELSGHSSAVLAAYPELGNGTGVDKVPGFWSIHKTVYGPNEATFKFLEDVFTEVIDIFPSEFIHIGGDEVPKDEWKASSVAQNVMKKHKLKDEHELQSWFVKRIEKFLNKKGRRIIGWDEILEGGLAPNATVMSWRGEKGGISAAKMGHNVIMSPNKQLYLDYYQAIDKSIEPLAIDGFLPLETVYAYNPRPVALTVEEQKHIIGVQGNMWTEYVATNKKMEYMLFPRVLALSEVAWTGLKGQNYEEFSTLRLPKRLAELEQRNINYRIPEAKIEVSDRDHLGHQTLTITSLVANSNIYYTIDNHKADNTATQYLGPILLPNVGKDQNPLTLKYIIETSGGRMSSMFTFRLGKD